MNRVRTKLDAERQELAEKYIPFGLRLARRYIERQPHLRHDFQSAAFYGLTEAARIFEFDRKVKFTTFARPRIHGLLIDTSKSSFPRGYENEQEFVPKLVTLSKDHAPCDPDLSAETYVEAIDTVEGLLKTLTRRQALVCRHYYVYGKTQKEIGDILSVSQSEIARLRRQALESLRSVAC